MPSSRGNVGGEVIERLSLKPRPNEKSLYQRAFDSAQIDDNSTSALQLLEQAHVRGDARATYALATWYIHGKNVEVNLSKAVKLLRSAHRHGIREATFDLALAFETGKGVSKSTPTAFRLYVDAAQKGDPDALRAVARCVFHGIGTSKSRELALLLQKLSAKSHDHSRKRSPKKRARTTHRSTLRRVGKTRY